MVEVLVMSVELQAAETSGVPFNLPEPKEKTRLVTLNMPESLIEELDGLARTTGNSRTKLIIHFCRAALEQLQQQESGAKSRGR